MLDTLYEFFHFSHFFSRFDSRFSRNVVILAAFLVGFIVAYFYHCVKIRMFGQAYSYAFVKISGF